MKRYTLGIDVGGTNIKLGIVNSYGRVFKKRVTSTSSLKRNKNILINSIIDSSNRIIKENNLSKKDFLGLGIGFPGLVDVDKGVIRSLTNIPNWENVPVKNIIQKAIGLRTYIDNDVNIFTLGEWCFGAGKGFRNLVCVTLGTGVGGGIVINNKLYRGQNNTAGEIGHISLNESGRRCNCRGFGCLERLIGNKHLLTKAKKIFRNVSLEDMTRLANKGNKKAIGFWEEAAEHLGNALANVINLLNPQCIIIGGGISNAPQCLFERTRQVIKKRAMNIPAKEAKILKTKLGNNAGIIGAHVLVKTLSNKK